jgi:osmotically-inducible protein OsmY
MKNVIIAALLGVLLGATGFWFLLQGREDPAVKRAERAAERTMSQAKETVSGAAADLKAALAPKLEALELRAQDIQEELQRTGKVVRRKARDLGEAALDATADARTTAAVMAKLAADRELSALTISVNTTHGRVTLSGTVSSPELIGKTMLLALETEGVRDVISTLQVK